MTLVLVVAMTLVAGLATSGCGSSAKPIPTPTSTSPSTITTFALVVPRSDGIYVSDVGNAVVGYRFLPATKVMLYAIEAPGTTAQQLKSDLTPENVLNNRGSWGVGSYDVFGNLCFTSACDGNKFSITDVTNTDLTIHYVEQLVVETKAYFVKF